MKKFLASLLGLLLPWSLSNGQQSTTVPPGTPVTITVSPAAPTPPPISITLKERHGHVTPVRQGFTHTGAGYIDVAQPTPDVMVVTMTGVVVAGGHPWQDSVATMNFDLLQCVEVSFDDPKLKRAKISIEGRVVGLLRSQASHKDCKRSCGAADMSCAQTSVAAERAEILTLVQTPHRVACAENLSLNDHEGPVEAPIVPGKYTIHGCFTISATHPRSLLPCKAASAEFAPDPALDPLWISYWEPFHGVGKKDFGYQVTIRIAADTSSGEEKKNEKRAEPVPAPVPK
jgi:hypothetical protein